MDDWRYGRYDERELIDYLGQVMAAVFGKHEERLLRETARRIDGSLGINSTMTRLEALHYLRNLSAEVARQIRDEAGEQAIRLVSIAAREGALSAYLAAAGGSTTQALAAIAAAPGAAATARIAMDLTTATGAVTERVLRWAPDVYQRVVGLAATGVTTGLDTSQDAQRAAWRELRRRGVTGFVDKGGRPWNLATYTEMATRTAVMRAYTDAQAEQATVLDADLYMIQGTSNACAECAAWFGKVLTKNGTPGRVKVFNQRTGRDNTITIHGTVADARAAHWQHPNCRCRLSMWRPGTPAPAVAERDPVKYDAEQRLRSIERRIRAAKRDQAGALDQADADQATAKIRALQATARGLVKEHGLTRQPRREQVNLGNQPAATT